MSPKKRRRRNQPIDLTIDLTEDPELRHLMELHTKPFAEQIDPTDAETPIGYKRQERLRRNRQRRLRESKKG